MSVFNSLGSNYDFNFSIKSLFSISSKSGTEKLIDKLEQTYGGKAYLFYKGRDAIEIALKTLQLDNSHYVAINGFTCYAVYKAIENANLGTHLIDIPNKGLNFTNGDLKKALSENKKIKVVIIQNTLGYPCEIEEIQKTCKENNLYLIEDLAHSAGTIHKNGKFAGSFGDFVTLSFSQDKIIDGVSGGALIVNKYEEAAPIISYSKLSPTQQLKDRVYPLLTFFIRNTYEFYVGRILHHIFKLIGILSKPMDETNNIKSLPNWYAKLIYSQIVDLSKNIEHRRKISKIYLKNLPKEILFDEVIKNIDQSSSLRFPIYINERKRIIKSLKEKGIYISDIWYDAPVAPKRYMEKIKYENDCPNSEDVSNRILNLPTHKNISVKIAEFISREILLCLQ